MNLLSIAKAPIVVAPDTTVMEAVEASLAARVGAVAVVDHGDLTGIFTERDMMYKVVANRMDPDTTAVKEVMTSPVISITSNGRPDEVLEMMLKKHFRHLPISSDGRKVEGMISIRDILQHLVNHLRQDVNFMQAYITDSSLAPPSQ